MNPKKALWEKGDFTAIAAFMRESGEALVESLGVKPPLRALDLGCGDGTTAVPLAHLGAEVTGIDIAKNLVAAGKRRAADQGLKRLKFQEGDACDLQGIDDHPFDLTVSFFGAMFAAKPFDVARGDGQGHKTRRSHRDGQLDSKRSDLRFAAPEDQFVVRASTSRGLHDPMLWGLESHVMERFAQAGVRKEKVSVTKDTYYFVSVTKSPSEFITRLRRFYGPAMNAFDAAEQSGTAEDLHSQLLELAKAHNKSTNDGTFIPATFLRVTVSL